MESFAAGVRKAICETFIAVDNDFCEKGYLAGESVYLSLSLCPLSNCTSHGLQELL